MRASCVSCLQETLVVAEDAPRTALHGGLELLDGGNKLPGIDCGGPLCGGQLLAFVKEAMCIAADDDVLDGFSNGLAETCA